MPKTACVGWPAGPVISGDRVEDLVDQRIGVEDVERRSRHRASRGPAWNGVGGCTRIVPPIGRVGHPPTSGRRGMRSVRGPCDIRLPATGTEVVEPIPIAANRAELTRFDLILELTRFTIESNHVDSSEETARVSWSGAFFLGSSRRLLSRVTYFSKPADRMSRSPPLRSEGVSHPWPQPTNRKDSRSPSRRS